METSEDQRIVAGDHLAYFLAGHAAPAGAYKEVQTGREIQMEQEGILPATCDGHVAVYIRQPMTWAEIDNSKKDGD